MNAFGDIKQKMTTISDRWEKIMEERNKLEKLISTKHSKKDEILKSMASILVNLVDHIEESNPSEKQIQDLVNEVSQDLTGFLGALKGKK